MLLSSFIIIMSLLLLICLFGMSPLILFLIAALGIVMPATLSGIRKSSNYRCNFATLEIKVYTLFHLLVPQHYNLLTGVFSGRFLLFLELKHLDSIILYLSCCFSFVILNLTIFNSVLKASYSSCSLFFLSGSSAFFHPFSLPWNDLCYQFIFFYYYL